MSGARAAVIGLDGVGLGLARDLVAQGEMPNLGSFMASGSSAAMTSTMPTVSNVSWTSFATGRNPGFHGVYGFTDIRAEDFRPYFPNFANVRAPTVWDTLGERGLRCIVVNVPGTYPARATSGVLISGFVALNLERAVYPRSLLPRLEQAGYKVDVDYSIAAERPEEFFCDLAATLEARRRVMLDLIDEERWDLFLGVITETDRLHHYYWHAWGDAECVHHERFLEFYRHLDEVLGALLDRLSGVPTVIMADHGHAAIEWEFYPNRWLLDSGFLAFSRPSPRSAADIDRATKAFVLDPGRIYVNLKGRYPTGSVDPAEADAVLEAVSEGLARVELEGARPVARVFGRDELYHGPCTDTAPDMVMHFNPGFDIKGSLRSDSLFGRSTLTGMHTYDDSFFACSKAGVDLADLAIVDVAPSLLALFSLPEARGLDGRIRDIG